MLEASTGLRGTMPPLLAYAVPRYEKPRLMYGSGNLNGSAPHDVEVSLWGLIEPAACLPRMKHGQQC